jgi:hypothetical protein
MDSSAGVSLSLYPLSAFAASRYVIPIHSGLIAEPPSLRPAALGNDHSPPKPANTQYIGMEAHKESISIAVRDAGTIWPSKDASISELPMPEICKDRVQRAELEHTSFSYSYVIL